MKIVLLPSCHQCGDKYSAIEAISLHKGKSFMLPKSGHHQGNKQQANKLLHILILVRIIQSLMRNLINIQKKMLLDMISCRIVFFT